MRNGNNIRQRKDGRFEARYIKEKTEDGKTLWGYCYGLTYKEAENKRDIAIGLAVPPRELSLLILGAGDHGKEVKELARSLRVFSNIAFLDDTVSSEEVLGKIEMLESMSDCFSSAIPAVGDNDLRKLWMVKLVMNGFVIPTLIHPSANVSPTAEIGSGTVICAGATVGVGAKIGRGCIVDSGAVINKNAEVPDWTLISCGEIYK